MNRTAMLERSTKETSVSVTLDLDIQTQGSSSTGIAFFDHMLDALQANARFNFELTAKGAIHMRKVSGTNDHHQAEAAFKALGSALGQAIKLTNRTEIPSTKGSLV